MKERDNYSVSVQRFDEFATQYANRFGNVSDYALHLDRFCGLITMPNAKILDLGCGPGNHAKFIAGKLIDPKIVGVDLAPQMIEIARGKVPDADFRLMDVRDISALDARFNGIVCSFCLPFLSKADVDTLIADCKDKLDSNAYLYLSTMEGCADDAGYESTSFSGDAQIYFNYHKREDLKQALHQNGFAVKYEICQDYDDHDGRVLTDLIFIAQKK